MKLVVEPSGVVGLAGVFAGTVNAKGLRVGAILSGGNADVGAVADWLRADNA
jgi:threonine dehydratase